MKQAKFFAVVFIGLIVIQPAKSSEPTYDGKGLSEWLIELKKSPSSEEVMAGMQQHVEIDQIVSKKRKHDEDAIRQIGASGIPTLLEILGAKQSNVKHVVSKLKSRELQMEYDYDPDANAEDLRSLAVDGFGILGTNAQSAVPQLTKLFHNPETRFQAIRALTKVGPAGFSVITNALADKDSGVRNSLIWVIGEEGGSDNKTVTQLLINDLKDPDPINRGNAATFVAGRDPAAIPPLIELLKSDEKNFVTVTGAAKGLSGFGPAAIEAAPILLSIFTNAVMDPDRQSARNWTVEMMWAMTAIDTNTAAKAEAFLLSCGPLGADNGYTTTQLPDGKELIAGGLVHTTIPTINNRILGGAMLFNPKTGNWTETGSMKVPRENHTATLLKNGKVLVAGGDSGPAFKPVSSAELYDPKTGQWTAIDSMNSPHPNEKAILQPDGKVRISGYIGDYRNRPDDDLYDPATGKWTTVADK